ncbi:MAG: hypothetical protein ACM3XN_10805 [Chloroflexota bacterium]
MRKEIPLLITLLAGLIYVIANFFSVPIATSAKNTLDSWFLISQAFAVLLGVTNLTLIHLRSISTRRTGWGFSVALLVSMYTVMIYGAFKTATDPFFNTIFFKSMINALSGTMFSLLVFYITSAAYRAFRIRSFEASLLLITAVIIMLGRAPVGDLISPWLPKATSWLLDILNVAGMRGIQIGAALGGIATALRVVVGIERAYLAGE